MSGKMILTALFAVVLLGCEAPTPEQSSPTRNKATTATLPSMVNALSSGCKVIEDIKTKPAYNNLKDALKNIRTTSLQQQSLCQSLSYLQDKNKLTELNTKASSISDIGTLNAAIRQEILKLNSGLKLDDVLLAMLGISFFDDAKTPVARRYVTPHGSGNQSGSDWKNALPGENLQQIIDDLGGGELWMQAGTYKPKNKHGFKITTETHLYGSFLGTERSLDERDYKQKTILSGDINDDDNLSGGGTNDNATTVLTIDVKTPIRHAITLDGIGITAGNTSDGDIAAGLNVIAAGADKKILIYKSALYANHNSHKGNAGESSGAGALKVAAHHNVQIVDSTFARNQGFAGAAVNVINSSANAANQLLIKNSTFKDNRAHDNGKGAAVASRHNHVVVSNTTFIDNAVPFFGAGGAMDSSQDDLQLDASTFTGNFSGSQGGALNIISAQKLRIRNSTFDDNVAKKLGGALYVQAEYNDAQQSQFENVRFYGNSSGRRGGALYFEGGTQQIDRATFYGNSTASVKYKDGLTVGLKQSGSKGGAVYLYGTRQTQISNATFAYNSSFANWGALTLKTLGQGSAIFNGVKTYGGNVTGSKLQLNYVTFFNNKANYLAKPFEGVAVFTEDGGKPPIIENSLFVGNQPIGTPFPHHNQYAPGTGAGSQVGAPTPTQPDDSLAGREATSSQSKPMQELREDVNKVEQIAYLPQSYTVSAVRPESQPKYDQLGHRRTAGDARIGAVQATSQQNARKDLLYITKVSPWGAAGGEKLAKDPTITLTFNNAAGNLDVSSVDIEKIKQGISVKTASGQTVVVNAKIIAKNQIEIKLTNTLSELHTLTIKDFILDDKGTLNRDYVYRFGVNP